MNPKAFVALAAVALLTTAAALVLFAMSRPWSTLATTGARLAPAMTAANPPQAIVVTHAGKELKLRRQDKAWVIESREGYPADGEKARALLVALGQAELVEAKTRLGERHALLEVEDPAQASAKAKGVKVLDASGAALAGVVVGKRRFEAFGTGRSGTYVRRAGEAQAWLANVEIDVPAEVRAWIKPAVLEIDAGRLARAAIEISGEEALRIERGEGGDAKAAFAGLPEGRKLKDQLAADAVLRALAQIDAEDVRKPVASPAGAEISHASFATRDGLEAKLRLSKEGDAHWLTIAVTADAGAKPEARSDAEALAKKVGGWEFRIAPAKASAILKRRADLFEGS
jgi:hypothetical protein